MFFRVSRRAFFQAGAAGVSSAALALLASSKEATIRKMTFTYKRIGDLEVKADVYRADDDSTRPVVVWIHGGALIMGHREGISGQVKQMMLDGGYALVSIDYRLAPETKLPAIIEDVEDAFRWLRAEGSKLFNVDTRGLSPIFSHLPCLRGEFFRLRLCCFTRFLASFTVA